MTGYIESACLLSPEAVQAIVQAYQQRADEGETAKHRHLVREYCQGNTLDLGSSGVPVVPWAIQVDLPSAEYQAYNPVRGDAAIHWRGSALDLPFKDGTVSTVHASHLLEDFEDWEPALREWDRVLKKPDGYLIVATPDYVRFRAAVERGQGDNLSHRSEHLCRKGAITEWLNANMASQKYEVLYDDFVSDAETEYSLLWVGRRLF